MDPSASMTARMPRAGERVSLDIQRLSTGGEGVARLGELVVFVPYAAPGDRLEAEITDVRARFARARVLKVLKASPDRVTPPCPYHFHLTSEAPSPRLFCGGCSWQHLRYEAQLAAKRELVRETLERLGGLRGISVRTVLGMPSPWRYRNKVQQPVGWDPKARRLISGFFSPGTHDIVPIDDCRVQPELSVAILRRAKALLEQFKIQAYEQGTHRGWIRHLLVRTATSPNQAALTFVGRTPDFPHEREIVQALLREFPSLAAVHLNVNPSRTNVILGRQWRKLAGADFIEERLGRLRFRLSPGSFFQVNARQAEVLYDVVREMAGSGPRLLDLYGGVGAVALWLADRFREVGGVEEVRSAVEDAEANAQLNGIRNARFRAAPVEAFLRGMDRSPRHPATGRQTFGDRSAGGAPLTVTLDPPRAGCSPAVLKNLLTLKPGRIVYVSCDPGTLARDLAVLSKGGYRVEEVQPVDLFPQTPHIETAVKLTKPLPLKKGGGEGFRHGKSPSIPLFQRGRTALILILFLAALWIPPLLQAASRVEIREGRFYVDGEPFFVRGIGYAPWRPHQRPGVSYTDTNRRWTTMDFERMKAAHFNVVRSWDALSPEDLALAERYGLMVLQGIWLDPRQDFSNRHNQDSCIAQARGVAEQSKDSGNVLGYEVMAEPWPEAVTESGEAETLEFLRRIKRAIQAVDPRPVSMDSWPPLAFLNHRDFDFVTINHFSFWPKSLNHALGFPGVIRWFADHLAAERPLLIGETGGYAVSRSTRGARGGAGGYSEYDQSVKDLQSLRGAVEGHAAGAVLVSWMDTWHYPSDPDTHDDDPWEWNGILGIPTDGQKDLDGLPRRIYEDVSRYNEVILVEPKANHLYGLASPIPVQAYGASNVAAMRLSVNGGDWKGLEGSGRGWWRGFVRLPKLARRRQKVAVEALDSSGRVLSVQEASFVVAQTPERILLSSQPAGRSPNVRRPVASRLGDRPKPGLAFHAVVTDSQDKPIARRKVDYGFFYPISLREAQGSQLTDSDGRVTLACPLSPEPKDKYLFVAVGTDSPDRVRTGDMRIFRLGL